MKKLLLILLCLPLIGFGQQTYVPDNNFEAYLENNGMGNGIPYDSSVFTSAIDTLIYLDLSFGAGTAIGFFDLTGIEDFTALTYLNCSNNQITSLDVSSNIALVDLKCSNNQLTSLDVSTNTALSALRCSNNQITSLDVSNNTALSALYCSNNQITSLDLSQNSSLYFFDISNNPFYCLNLANGNSLNFNDCNVQNTPNLYCIEVDDTSNVTGINTPDSQTYYSNNCSNSCSTTEIFEIYQNKELLKVTDLLGREAKQTNQILFFIYDDGTVEKRIVIE